MSKNNKFSTSSLPFADSPRDASYKDIFKNTFSRTYSSSLVTDGLIISRGTFFARLTSNSFLFWDEKVINYKTNT